MPTNLAIDDRLIEEARKTGGHKTKKEAVTNSAPGIHPSSQTDQFRRIRDYLRDFPNINLESTDYEEAARISNDCRRAGIAVSPVDTLICSVSHRRNWEIFTTDLDFVHYKRVVQIRLLDLS